MVELASEKGFWRLFFCKCGFNPELHAQDKLILWFGAGERLVIGPVWFAWGKADRVAERARSRCGINCRSGVFTISEPLNPGSNAKDQSARGGKNNNHDKICQ